MNLIKKSAVFISLVTLMSFHAFAGEEVNYWDEIKHNNENVFDHETLVEMYKIPQDEMNNLSTEELMELTLTYPMMGDMYAFNSAYEGYNHLVEDCNLIEEMILRDDFVSVVMEYYSKLEIPSTALIDKYNISNDDIEMINSAIKNDDFLEAAKNDVQVRYSCDFLEILIIDNWNKFNSPDNVETLKVLNEKVVYKRTMSDIWPKETKDYLLQYLIGSGNVQVNGMRKSYSTNLTIQTPSGTNVTVRYSDSTNTATVSSAATLANTYNATIVSSATDAFNCHSYAWLQTLYPSLYVHMWLSSVSAFVADSAYTNENTPSVVGEIALYRNGSHSALVHQLSVYNSSLGRPQPKFTSKWGTGYIYLHFPANCPYDTTNLTYYRR